MLPTIYPVTCHIKHVGPGSTFVAIKGFQHDGAQFIQQAIEQGATHIIVETHAILPAIPEHIRVTRAHDTRQALATASAQALNYPAKSLTIIGITGTAGKTTTSFLCEHLLAHAGIKTALLGSIKNKIGDKEEASELTSPTADYLYMFFAECVKQDVKVVVMEVSSHALALARVHGIPFAAAGFTNLSPEHMDFHPTLEDYFSTKYTLLEHVVPQGAIVINTDDQWGKQAVKLLQKSHVPHNIIGFGQTSYGQCTISFTQSQQDGLTLTLNHESTQTYSCKNLYGAYNAYNISMALLLCHATCNIPWLTLSQGLFSFTGVPGRLQQYKLANGATACIDFAHKPAAFKAVLETLRPLTNHLIVVFGCGGNRDTSKRPIMGKLASEYADLIIITDDNPRYENRETIAQNIYAGIPLEHRAKTIIELDRHTAIYKATRASTSTSIIAILGKGNETYYIIHGEKRHFSDAEEIAKY